MAEPDVTRWPSVDIVVNNYNYGRFVGCAIESALAQTHRDVKVIVVDDGSTDDSRELLEAYESRVELVLKENGGQASALNAGFARSAADVVIFLDADDALRPQAAALVASCFAADPRLVKIQYRMEVIDANGLPSGAITPPAELPLPSGDLRRAELVFPFDLVWAATSGNAFRTETLRRIMPIPERDFGPCADWYLVHLTALLGPVLSLRDVAASYRVHGANHYAPGPRARPRARAPERPLRRGDGARDRAARRRARTRASLRPHPLGLRARKQARLAQARTRAPPVRGRPGWRLALDGARAASRRFDVSLPMKLIYVGWFTVMAAAPRPLSRRLAELLLSRQRRGGLNRVLGRFYKWNGDPDANAGSEPFAKAPHL